MAGTRVALLFGGRSVEHEVSLTSARGVALAMRETDLVCVPIGVTPRGRWLSPDLSQRILEDGRARVVAEADHDDGVRFVIDPGGAGLRLLDPDASTEPVAIDVVFPLVHGWGGEDGRLQGAMDLAALPCVGAGVTGSAVAMDKAFSKIALAQHGIPVAPSTLVRRSDFDADPLGSVQTALDRLSLPLFVKPANGGSSIGISKVLRAGELRGALETAFEHDRRVLVEQGIDAREIECAVLGNDRPAASGLGEILPSREFYDYEAKYVDDDSRLIIPADLEPGLTDRMREVALEAYRALDLAGFARVDFLLERGTGKFFLNEVNTLPGFTPISMFPKLWSQEGLSFPRLIERLVELAVERSRNESNRRTERQGS